jgi:hypothetical protein
MKRRNFKAATNLGHLDLASSAEAARRESRAALTRQDNRRGSLATQILQFPDSAFDRYLGRGRIAFERRRWRPLS